MSRSLGWGRGAPEIPTARGRAHLPTSHLGGRGRGGMQSEPLWPPGSAGGSPSKAAVPRGRGRSSGSTRGVSDLGKDLGSPPPPLASRSLRSQSRSPRNRKKPIRSSSNSSAAAPSARGRPRGSMAVGRGCSRRGATPGCGLHRGPCGPGRERGESALGGGARRPPDLLSRAESPPHLLQRLGDPDLTLSEDGWGAGKGEMKEQASPVGAGASPAPNLGSGFISAWLNPKGRGDPSPGWGGEGGPAPPLPGLTRTPTVGGRNLGTLRMAGGLGGSHPGRTSPNYLL